MKNTKLDDWFKRQATKIEQENYYKKLKSQKEKEEKERVEEDKNKKKMQSTYAYSEWLKKKEQEKKLTTKSSKNEKKRNTNLYSTSKDEENKNNFKISIGPYSTGKALRIIEKKLANDGQVLSYYEPIEKDKKKKEKIDDDSFQDLSSIKKDDPVNENVGDDYE